MWDCVRRWGAGFVGVAAILALGHQAASGQQPAPAATSNVYVNPLASAGRFPNSAALGQSLSGPSSTGGLGYGSLGPGIAAPATSYGSLAASYANPNLGYGSLMNNPSNNNNNNNGYGVYGGYGIYGTQWMMNPYQGYLSGAADVTRANAEYQLTIQQARLVRQEGIRSSIQTRRALIEELEWERSRMPDPEKIRQNELERELGRARHSPPSTEIWSARSLNALLRHLIAEQGRGATSTKKVPLTDEILNHINLTVGDSRGNVGLLKDSGSLQWPLPLMNEVFKDPRENINSLMARAFKSVSSGTPPDSSTIQDLRAQYDTLRRTLDANVDKLTPDEYLAANRYLNYVKNTLTALKDPNILNFFNNNWKANAKSVNELVQFMRDKGLWFAPATPTDEPAYIALYYALASYDSNLQRTASTTPVEGER